MASSENANRVVNAGRARTRWYSASIVSVTTNRRSPARHSSRISNGAPCFEIRPLKSTLVSTTTRTSELFLIHLPPDLFDDLRYRLVDLIGSFVTVAVPEVVDCLPSPLAGICLIFRW